MSLVDSISVIQSVQLEVLRQQANVLPFCNITGCLYNNFQKDTWQHSSCIATFIIKAKVQMECYIIRMVHGNPQITSINSLDIRSVHGKTFFLQSQVYYQTKQTRQLLGIWAIHDTSHIVPRSKVHIQQNLSHLNRHFAIRRYSEATIYDLYGQTLHE